MSHHYDEKHIPTRRKYWFLGLLAVGLGFALIAVFVPRFDTHVAAQPTERSFTAQEVTDILRQAGLTVTDIRQEPVGRGSASGPPITEREAWEFSLPGLGQRGGRILVFADNASLQKKAKWYKSVGVEGQIITKGNIILWIDPAVSPSEVARYHRALANAR